MQKIAGKKKRGSSFQVFFKFRCFAVLGHIGATFFNIITASLSLVVLVVQAMCSPYTHKKSWFVC